MKIGINAGFGHPVAGELPLLASLGFSSVRQDLFAHEDRQSIEDLVGEFAGQTLTPIFLLAGGTINHSGSTRRIEPDQLAERGRRAVRAAAAAGLTSYAIEIGNEPDLAVDDYAKHPAEFAEAIRQTREAVRELGFTGPVISGGISNLNERGLGYLRAMIQTGAIADDVTVGFHRYPEAGRGPNVAHAPFGSREEEWSAFRQLVGDRATACTEFGYHSAEDSFGFAHLRHHRRSDQEVTDGVLWDLDFFSRHGVTMAVLYQLNDGPNDTALDRYGLRRFDQSLKPVAEALRAQFGSGEHDA
jgi:hypothetical protein